MKEYEKLKYISSYGSFYGRKPALADLTDTNVLNSQKFSQLQSFKVINETTKSYLDSWQGIEQEDEYKGFAISAIRSLYTFIKNGEPNNSTNRVSFKKFKPNELVGVERYDKLIEEVSMNVKKQFFNPKVNQFFKNRKRIVVPSQAVKYTKPLRGTISFERVNPKAGTIKFLKGNGNITSLNMPKDTMFNSLYNESYQGKVGQDKAKNVHSYFTVSTATGAWIPDRKMLTFFQTKLGSISKDITKTQKRMSETISQFKFDRTNANAKSSTKLRRNLSLDV